MGFCLSHCLKHNSVTVIISTSVICSPLFVQLDHQPQNAVGSGMLGSKFMLKIYCRRSVLDDITVYLHVPDKLLRLEQPAGVGHQLGVVLLLGEEEALV